MAEAGLTYRAMTEADLETAAALEAANFTHPWRYEDLADAFARDTYLYYVAEAEDGIKGLAGILIGYDEAEVLNVSVDKDCRRQGIAKELLRQLLKAGRERGVKDFALDVRCKNTAAIALYEGLGFVREGMRKDFYRDPKEDAYVYRLRG